MPQDSSLEVAGRIDDWWSTAKRDILADPFGQMASAGLFQIGLPGAGAALDGEGQDVPARTIGVRLLARDIVDEIRELLAQGPPADEATSRALAAYDLLSSVAREPRKGRQIRLGNSIGSEKQ